MNKNFVIMSMVIFSLLSIGTVYAACPDTHPKLCSSVNLCFANWVDCGTLKYCKDNYYGCASGNKLICYQSTPYCFDKCIDENTIAQCGSGVWGCWIDGCGPNTGSVPTCYQGSYHCCPKDYPVYRGDYNQCWKEGWQCTSNDQCGTDNICVDYKCTIKKICPTCPPPTAWSSCQNGKMQRSIYKCDSATNYVCVPQIQTSKCGPECESDKLEHKLFVQSTSQPYELKYNCPTEIPEVAFASIKDKLNSVWYYDQSATGGDKWYVWTPTGTPTNLDVILCGETYSLMLKEREVTFKCPGIGQVCLQVLTLGYNPTTGECKQFSTSCLDPGFSAVDRCPIGQCTDQVRQCGGPCPPCPIDWTFYIIIATIIIIVIIIIWLLVFKK